METVIWAREASARQGTVGTAGEVNTPRVLLHFIEFYAQRQTDRQTERHMMAANTHAS